MKKIIITIILAIAPMLISIGACASAPDDMRGVWVSTVYNLDFPQKATTDSMTLKSEIDKIISSCADTGYNAIFLQVRPSADSLYPSQIFPWSKYLTGQNGLAPYGGFDPLAYWVSKCHEYFIELHAWINPYRVTKGGESELYSLSRNHPAVLHPEWLVKYKDGNYYFNPGIPEVRELVLAGAEEILNNYAVDGIHMDDYFYPGTDFNDSMTFYTYNDGSYTDVASWRRNNVNILVASLHTLCGNYGRVFGISPSGIWDNKSSNPLGSDTRGMSSYSQLCADSRAWVKNGWVDYLAPQIYWEFGYSIADYEVLAKWWSDVFNGSTAKLYIGLATYRGADAKWGSPWYMGNETARQMEYNYNSGVIDGEIHFRYKLINDSPYIRKTVKDRYGAFGAKNRIKVIVNGIELACEYPPVAENGRTLVTMREVFEALGAEVYWINATQTATAYHSGSKLSVKVGESSMTVDGVGVELDVPARIIDSKTYIPLRAVSESFGFNVTWDGENNTVIING